MGLEPCGSVCVNFSTNSENCGSCGNDCGAGGRCIGGTCETCAAQETACDNRDDDCDGMGDEGLTRDCSNLCGTGVETCDRGSWGTCSSPTPTVEACDGEDNDCDGVIDDGCSCEDGDIQSCGSCEDGLQGCSDGEWGECEGGTAAVSEVCDGVDNDCDERIDEDLPLGGYWYDEPNDDCETYNIVEYPLEEGGRYMLSGHAYKPGLTADRDVIRFDVLEYADTILCIACCGSCGGFSPDAGDTCFECMNLDITLTSPDDLDLEACLSMTRPGAGTCEAPIERVCTNDGGATDDTLSMAWEGWCNRDENLIFFLEVFPRDGDTAPSSCQPYDVTIDFSGGMPDDDRCGAGYVSW